MKYWMPFDLQVVSGLMTPLANYGGKNYSTNDPTAVSSPIRRGKRFANVSVGAAGRRP